MSGSMFGHSALTFSCCLLRAPIPPDRCLKSNQKVTKTPIFLVNMEVMQTVNLLAYAFLSSNLRPTTIRALLFFGELVLDHRGLLQGFSDLVGLHEQRQLIAVARGFAVATL